MSSPTASTTAAKDLPSSPTSPSEGTTTTEQQQQILQATEDKAVTFRKRRLSLTRHHLGPIVTEAAATTPEQTMNTPGKSPDYPEEEENNSHHKEEEATAYSTTEEDEQKAHTFRKRRLSLTHSSHHPLQPEDDEEEVAGSHRPDKRRRRLSSVTSAASASTTASQQSSSHASPPQLQRHTSQTLHATQLLGGPMPPPSPAVHPTNVLYQQVPAPPLLPSALDLLSTGSATHEDDDVASWHPTLSLATQHLTPPQRKRLLHPPWKVRHDPTHEEAFPFPRDMVGTYSAHGVEPIYDSEYEEEDDPDDEDYREEEEEEEEEEEAEEAASPPINANLDSRPTSPDSHANNDNENDGNIGTAELLTTADTAAADPAQVEAPTSPGKHTVTAKINQDRGGIAYPYGNSRRTALFAVYDGHGQGGELVSQYALHEVQRRLEQNRHFRTDLERALRETFTAVDQGLQDEPLIEPYYAGTTAVVAVLRNDRLTLANAGDSRAVLARRVETNDGSSTRNKETTWHAVDLTQDQNPDTPQERARIQRMGGTVTDPPGPGLSARVWLDPGCTQVGLAMARSIGDHAVATVGVIADPVVTHHTVEADDDFIILASDGVWEFLSSQEAVDIVSQHLEDKGATKACQALIEAAAHRWHDEEGAYRDDITAIVVRLPGLWDKLGASKS